MNFEGFFARASTSWEPCSAKSSLMKTMTPFPPPRSATSVDVVVLTCRHQIQFDPAPLMRLFAERNPAEAEDFLSHMLEEIALRLDLMQQGLAVCDFRQMRRPARRIGDIAMQIGLTEVAIAAVHVRCCLMQEDGVALEATMARLERAFDVAVSEIWNFRDA